MGKITKKSDELNKIFYEDRTLTKVQLRTLAKAVEKAGGRNGYLLKVGAIRENENGGYSVIQVEGLRGKEVIKGTGLRYVSDIPMVFWEGAFDQLDRHLYGVTKGDQENQKSLDEFATKLSTGKLAENLPLL